DAGSQAARSAKANRLFMSSLEDGLMRKRIGGTSSKGYFTIRSCRVAKLLLQAARIQISSNFRRTLKNSVSAWVEPEIGGIRVDTIGQILTGIGGLGGFICFILVVVQMFQRGSTGLA